MIKYLLFVLLLPLTSASFYAQLVITSDVPYSCDGSDVVLTSSSPSDCNSYTNSNIAFAPLALSGAATTVSLSDDAVSAAISMGFTFNFFCNDYTNAYISSNGFVKFTSAGGSGCCSGQNLPNGGTPNNLIAFAWEDIDPGNGGQPAQNLVRYETVGVAPNRIFIVDFFNVDHYSSGNNITVQTLLYETTNIIEIHTTTMPSDGGSHTMGLENSDGTIGFTVAGRNSSSWSATNEGIRFSPTICTGVTYDWQSPLGTSIGAGNSITVSPTAAQTYHMVTASSCGPMSTSINLDVATLNVGNDTCVGAQLVMNPSTTGFPVDCNDYDITSIAFSTQALSGAATTVSLSDDAVSAAIPMGFSFNFFCTNYTNAYISSNGFITFASGSPNGCCTGQNLPNTGTPNNLIAFAWEDIDPGNGGQPAENLVRYETIGTAPNRIFIVDFFNVDHFSNGNNITVQTLLYETSNVIEIHTTTMPTDGGSHTMGIENSGGTIAFTVAGRNSASWSATNEGVRIAPVSSVTASWVPPATVSDPNILMPTISPASQTTYTLTVDDGLGCVLSDNITLDIGCWLPVELISFDVQCDAEYGIVNWRTASEINNDKFLIQHYLGNDNWEDVAEINGAGNSNVELSYSVKINDLKSGYYRLAQVDYNGVAEDYNPVYVKCREDFMVYGFPNPTEDIFNIRVDGNFNEVSNVQLLDSYSKLLFESNMRGKSYELDVSKYAPGVYFVKVTTLYNSNILRIVVK